jgi:hypothetical protein
MVCAMTNSHVPLHELICELAYGRRMSFAEMMAYYSVNDVGSLQKGGEKPDPLGLVEKYETAKEFILRQAVSGLVSVYARRGKDSDNNARWYPKTLHDYERTPKEVFIARHQFGPGNPPVLWAENESPFEGLLRPVVTARDAATLSKKWLSGARDAKAVSDTDAPKNKGGRPKAVDWDIVKTEALRLMDHHGEFISGGAQWNAQARLEVALKIFCENRFGHEPADSTFRGYIPAWLIEWRANKTGSSET